MRSICKWPNAGSLPEVVGDGGVHYAPRDAEALGRALGEVLRSTEQRTMWAARASARAKQFSWSATADHTLAVLREAAAVGRMRRIGRACALVPKSLRWVA